MKNIFIKRGIIGGASAWVTNKRHKIKDGEHIRIMKGSIELGNYIARHSTDSNRSCDNCPLNRFNGTNLCIFKLNGDWRHESLCADADLLADGKLIYFTDVNAILEDL